MSSIQGILRSKAFHSTLGITVSIVLIIWLVFSLEWNEVWRELKNVQFWVFAPSLLLLVAHFILRAWRWRYLLKKGSEIDLRKLFDAIMMGNFANLVLPLRAGEFIRPYMLSTFGRTTFAQAFVSVIIERFLDLSMVLLSFSLIVASLPGLPPLATKGALFLTVMALAILVMIVVGTLFPKSIKGISEFFMQPFPVGIRKWALHFLSEFLDGAAVLSEKRNLIFAVLLTGFVWAVCYYQFFVFFYLFEIPPTTELAVTSAVMVALAVAMPSAPGFIGVYQTGCVAAFALFNLSAETAMAFALITHVFQYLVFVPYGAYILSRYRLSLSQLRNTPQ